METAERPRLLVQSVSRAPCRIRLNLRARRRRLERCLPPCILLFAVIVFAIGNAFGQAVPALKNPPDLSALVTFTDAKPDLHYYGDYAVYGLSAGGFIQTRHIVGVELRGSLLREGGLEHVESVLAGPRVAMHFGRVSPYLSLLGGAGNVWWWSIPPGKNKPGLKLDEGVGTQLALLGGIDVRLHHHIKLRVGEISCGKIYLPDRSLTLTASAGVVYRLR